MSFLEECRKNEIKVLVQRKTNSSIQGIISEIHYVNYYGTTSEGSLVQYIVVNNELIPFSEIVRIFPIVKDL
jgi:hypothetical protein